MYENESFFNILNRALDKVPTDVDKRQGSIIYDSLAPVCAELAQVYIALDWVLKEGFADTSSSEYLIKRARERGLSPYPATSSIILAELTGNINLKGGERFNAEDINFYYIGEKEDKYYKLNPLPYTGEGYGTAPIGHFVTIKPVETQVININTIL